MYSSFATAYVQDKIYLIYNDNPQNLTAPEGRAFSFRKNKNAVVVCAVTTSSNFKLTHQSIE